MLDSQNNLLIALVQLGQYIVHCPTECLVCLVATIIAPEYNQQVRRRLGTAYQFTRLSDHLRPNNGSTDVLWFVLVASTKASE
jgi:hypothetical protein